MPQMQLTQDECTAIADALKQQVTSAQRAQKTGKTPQIVEVYKLHEATLKELESKFLKAANSK